LSSGSLGILVDLTGMTQPWRDRIVSDPDLHHGEPCVRGTRVSVGVVVASMADLSIDELLVEYPQLAREDVKACLLYSTDK
jgi:uncharacterized protein (DUF433 family)